MASQSPDSIYRFGAFELDTRTERLFKNGRRIPLAPQPLSLLTLLVRQPERTVTREEIRKAIWGETVVSFDTSLNACVRKLRSALNDPAEASRFVATEPRRGYRFVAPLERVTVPPTEAQKDTVIPKEAERSGSRGIPVMLLTVAVVLSVLVWFRGSRPIPAPETVPTPSTRLAVLPFEDLTDVSGNGDGDYFAAALTDELIVRLTGYAPGHLSVVARTSSIRADGSETGVAFGRRLGVDYVIHGTVLRSDQGVRVNAKLVATGTGEHVWADSFTSPRGESLLTPARLSGAIASGVGELIVEESAVSTFAFKESGLSPDNPDAGIAYDAFVKGRYHLNASEPFDEKRIETAIASFRLAESHAPEFARAYVGLAEAHVRLASLRSRADTAAEDYSEARRAAERALALDPMLAEAHLQLALASWFADWSWADAKASFERGLAINPGIATLQHWYAYYLSSVGRHEEAIAAVRNARQLDPLSRAINSDVGLFYYFARQPEQAVFECTRTLELEPNFAVARHCLVESYRMLGAWDEAAKHALAWMAPGSERDLALTALDSKDILSEFDRRRAGVDGSISPYLKAISWARIGEIDRAFDELDRAIASRSPWVVVLDIDPSLDALRETPRYAGVLERIHFPREARARNASFASVAGQSIALPMIPP